MSMPRATPTLCRFAVFTFAGILALLTLPVADDAAVAQNKSADLSDQEVAKRLGLTDGELRRLHQDFGMTNELLLGLSQKEMHAWYRKLARVMVQRDREIYNALALKNEKGLIPEGATLLAAQQFQRLLGNLKTDKRVAGLPVGPSGGRKSLLPPTAGLSPQNTGWDHLGPDLIGGRTRALLIHPNNPTIMYAGSACGGIWRTVNGGDSWEPLSDLMANMAVCCLVMDPTNPQVIYAGTGEGYGNEDAVRGGGIYKTEDGGETWQPLPIPDKLKTPFQYVNRLAISSNGKVLLAAVGAVGLTPELQAGIYRSVDRRRHDWQLAQKGYFGCVSVDPKDDTKAVAGGLNRSPDYQGQAFYTTDAGESWQIAIDHWLKYDARTSGSAGARAELTYAAANTATLYASVDIDGGQLWRSDNGGRTYKRIKAKHRKALKNPLPLLNNQGWYDNVVWAGHPADSNLVIVGGVDLWKSTNGGATFEEISDWQSTQSAHADHHVIVAHPEFGKKNHTLFFGNDGGIFRVDDVTTLDRHKGWTPLSNRYVVTQFHGAAGHAKTGLIVAGTQDNGTLKLDLKSGKWEKVWGGDGGFCAIDQDDPNYRYGEAIFLSIFRADKEGNVEFISGFREDATKNHRLARLPAPYNIADAANPEGAAEVPAANFIAPFILDPNNQKRLLAGGKSLWVTNDARAPQVRWEAIKKPDVANNFISAIAVAKGNSEIIWVGHNNSSVYVAENGLSVSPKWTRVDHGKTPLPARKVTRIVIDPKNHKHVYVTFGGYSKSNLWKTENGGETWADLSKTLPEVPFRTLAIHPRKSEYLYLGTEVGVFASEDGGQNWSATNEGATNCRVDELFWMNENLVAATHGRGVFRINLARVARDD